MTPPARRRSFVPSGGGTSPTADTAPTPADVVSDSSDIPRKQAWNIGHSEPEVPSSRPADEDFSLSGLMSGAPDPEFDRLTKSYAIPRYLVEALRLYHVKTRRSHQDIVTDALRKHLPAGLVEACRNNADRR